jgi:hypothetical protein
MFCQSGFHFRILTLCVAAILSLTFFIRQAAGQG